MKAEPSTLSSNLPIQKNLKNKTDPKLVQEQIKNQTKDKTAKVDSSESSSKSSDVSLKKPEIEEIPEAAAKEAISNEGKEIAKKSAILKVKEIQKKKFGNLEEPGVFYISGFDWFGASSVKGNYDGIRDMSEATDGGQHFAWDDKEGIIAEIKKRTPDQPIVLVGHSFGGDTAMEIANELNSLEHGFRKIDLLITLDSVGFDNDIVPANVKKNINFLAQDNSWINDTGNWAQDYRATEVANYLRHEAHAELDDSIEIQSTIIDEIHKIV